VRPRDWPRLVLVAGPFALQEILGQIVFRIDVVLLSLFTSNSVVGAYGAAARLLEATLFLAWSSGASVLPMFSYLGRDSRPSLDRAYRASLTFVGGMVVPVAVTLFVCAGPIVSLLYGRRYDDAVPVLRWLSFAVVAYSVGYIAGTLVLVRRPGRLTVMVTAVAAAVNVLLNLVLIPTLAAVGAAVATLATEVLLTTMLMVLTRRVVPAPGWGPSAAAVALSGALMGAAMIPFAGRLAVAVPVGVVTYVVALAVVGSRLAGPDAAFVRAHLARSRPPAPTQGAAIGSIRDSLP
jgi:O-antigen/teichoic acid export membrane protein